MCAFFLFQFDEIFLYDKNNLKISFFFVNGYPFHIFDVLKTLRMLEIRKVLSITDCLQISTSN